jgi:hypothetical protein
MGEVAEMYANPAVAKQQREKWVREQPVAIPPPGTMIPQ